MTVYNKIRAALEVELSNVAGIPYVKYQGTTYSPNTGTPYISCRLVPTSRRPAEVGNTPFNRYQGLFTVNVHTPENQGSNNNQLICNSILSAFPAGTHDLAFDNQTVRIEYTEQLGSFEDSPWYITPITIGWYAYDKE